MKSKQTKKLVILSLFIAIELLLALTPLGFIAIGPIRSTTLHIPVILAGIMLGSKEGMIVGFVFGLISVITNTMAPTPASFVFSPFYEFGGVGGNGFSLIIAFGPRMMLGALSGFIYRALSDKKDRIKVILASCISSFMHTLFVMAGIYIFFGPQYADIKSVGVDQLLMLLASIVTTNGIIEMIVGTIIVYSVYKVLKPMAIKEDKK